jgi:hypothetical protein
LAETVAPELTSEHARLRVSEIRAVLAQIDWDDAGFQLKSRAGVLAERLAQSGPWVDGRLPDPPGEESFEAYQAYWGQLSAVAVGALEALAAHLDNRPDDDLTRATYQRLLGCV